MEECLVEAWQLHHTEARKAQPSSPSPPPPRLLGRQLHPSTQLGTLPRPGALGSSPAAAVRTRSGPDGVGSREAPSLAGVEGEGRTVWRGAGSAQMTGLAVTGGGGEGAGPAVGPAEYLQWLGDMSSMLVHEQWRKDVSFLFVVGGVCWHGRWSAVAARAVSTLLVNNNNCIPNCLDKRRYHCIARYRTANPPGGVARSGASPSSKAEGKQYSYLFSWLFPVLPCIIRSFYLVLILARMRLQRG